MAVQDFGAYDDIDVDDSLQTFVIIDAFCLWAEIPSGSPACSVHAVNSVDLQYLCEWFGGTPPAQLSFPALSNSSSAAGNLSVTVAAAAGSDLNWKTVTCTAEHPIRQDGCDITASQLLKTLTSFS